MRRRREIDNIGVRHGEWGEDVAVAALRRKGWVIVARNVHPCSEDERLELDIIAYDRGADAMVFVEVKQHARHDDGGTRLRGIDRRKLMNLRRAATAWRLENKWHGAFRFDVIEVYGTPGCRTPEVDHIERVALFTPRERFVDWS